jgi:hypothetical protein
VGGDLELGEEEVPDVLGEKVRHLHRGEVAAALELRLVRDVVQPLGQRSHLIDGAVGL